MDKIIDYAKIAVIAYVGIFIINHGLDAVGLSQFKAK
jgi:hypothetical protein